MSLKKFLIINAVLFLPFGIIMLIFPSIFFPLIGVDLDLDGIMMASMVGSMLLSFGLICWMARNGKLTDPNLKAILLGNLVFHSIDSFLTGKSAITGVMNQMGYMFSIMHLIFALGFLFYLWKTYKNN